MTMSQWVAPLPWRWALSFPKVISGLVSFLDPKSVCFQSSDNAILVSIESDHKIDVASDFLAQYTTRQKYRHSDTFSVNRLQMGASRDNAGPEESTEGLEKMLCGLYQRVNRGERVSNGEIRDALRRGAAVLCSSSHVHPLIAHYLVALPFRVFSKELIRLGVSLWLGVIHENPRTEPRILVEVLEWWERSVEHGKGLFDPSFV